MDLSDVTEIVRQHGIYMKRWNIASPAQQPIYNFKYVLNLSNDFIDIAALSSNGFALREFNTQNFDFNWNNSISKECIYNNIVSRCSTVSSIHHNRITLEEELFCPETLWKIAKIPNIDPQIFNFVDGRDYCLASDEINKWAKVIYSFINECVGSQVYTYNEFTRVFFFLKTFFYFKSNSFFF